MNLPRAIRNVRAQSLRPAVDPHGFNRGFDSPMHWDLPDALRGSERITGNQTAVFDQIEQAARNGSTRRR
jgi:hypothetical protein